jgi:AcrR family transcriptional regulator
VLSDDCRAHDRNRFVYQEGIRAIGIDTVVARSGVSKSSLYRTFESKDDLIAAFVEEQNRRFWRWWDEITNRYTGAPRKQIAALFDGVAGLIANPQFRGCPFINVATEFPDRQHPGAAIACSNKREMGKRLRLLARALGARDPAKTWRPTLAFDGWRLQPCRGAWQGRLETRARRDGHAADRCPSESKNK